MRSLPARRRLELTWGAFALANVYAMYWAAGGDGGTIPFHLIWVSLTLLYGFTVWRVMPTAAVLAVVMIVTGGLIVLEVARGPTRIDELAEVPLMAAMFGAMVWHARRRVEAEQRVVAARARELNFVRDSSHHLKTPLALARAYTELIASEGSAAQERDAGVVLHEIDRLSKIVDGMLLVTTSDSAQPMNRRPVDLESLVLGVASRWMDAVDREITGSAPPSTTIVADGERLECALDALVENAVDATVPGGVIRITGSLDGEVARISVADDGRGIPPDALEHVFERFWTAAGRSSRGGTGLGLSIVKAIAEAHGGSVRVSTPGRGAVFTMALPLADGRSRTAEPTPRARPRRGPRRVRVTA